MSTAVPFVSVAGLPTLITGPGQYVTRCGEIVTVESVDRAYAFGRDGTYPGGPLESWHRTGRLFFGCESSNDIVRAAPDPATLEKAEPCN